MTLIINAHNGCKTENVVCLLRTNNLSEWLDKISELNKTYHFNENNSRWIKNIDSSGNERTIFSFPSSQESVVVDKWKRTAFCRKPEFIFYGIPEGAL
ncbi:MAG: hypothetical protein J6T10_00345 [Methanobrevibacter sp.]|nr:hypothetical protein [Methanobrevibacter sp.]